jgi:hypothetical protein
MGLMYITSTEYNTLTGRPASECTNLRLMIACKLLDSRIGNYPTNNGYKINWTDWVVIYKGQYQTLHQSKIDAVKLWVATMISYLTDNNNKPPSAANNLKLGRFSVGKSNVNNSALPNEIIFADSVLISSGIINCKV